ncbi:hypothetical protein [Amycolatopsis sp. NBC_01480]|uniref:hypothetical protein n=1 Tax=Amycolatopsis sp. NBC_01480 TaxID=2903562 RepID=UPI002E2E5C8F|nr:hypothetical protein [Amycolatopsis sp. NBC_01480]
MLSVETVHKLGTGRRDVDGVGAVERTVSRLMDSLAEAGPKALTAIRSQSAEVRLPAWELAEANGPAADGSVIEDVDGMLVLAHAGNQDVIATWKKNFGHHPLVAFVDHGQVGSGEPAAALQRPKTRFPDHGADRRTR